MNARGISNNKAQSHRGCSPARRVRLAQDERLIVALDAPDLASALTMARRLRGLVRTLKVGSALFTESGPRVIQRLRQLGFSVMLDLKFFDIPSTVEGSCRAAVHQQVSMLTVHASGGQAMLEAAVRGCKDEARRLRSPRPLVFGVTVLTSVKHQASSVTSQVVRLARQAVASGCDGVVASAQEADTLRKRFGARVRIACPGIRLTDHQHHDQQRVATPAEALASGADWLIVGRPITAARQPRAAAQALLRDMEDRHAC